MIDHDAWMFALWTFVTAMGFGLWAAFKPGAAQARRDAREDEAERERRERLENVQPSD